MKKIMKIMKMKNYEDYEDEKNYEEPKTENTKASGRAPGKGKKAKGEEAYINLHRSLQ